MVNSYVWRFDWKWLLIPLYFVGFYLVSQYSAYQFFPLLAALAGLFSIYFITVFSKTSFSAAWVIAMVFFARLPFFFELPSLNLDFFRYLWDGMMLSEGLNPFAEVPAEQNIRNFTHPEFAAELFGNIPDGEKPSFGSLFQFVFSGLAYFFAGPNILAGVNVLRGLFFITEIVLFIYVVSKPARNFRRVGLYLLNPLVVIEGVGNVNFLAIAIIFIAIGVIEFKLDNYRKPALSLAFATGFNFFSLAFLPVFLTRFTGRKHFEFFGFFLVFIALFLGMSEFWKWQFSFQQFLNSNFQEYNSFSFSIVQKIFENYFPPFLYPWQKIVVGGLGIIAMVVLALVSRRGRIMESCLAVYIAFLLFFFQITPATLIPVVFFAIAANRNLILLWSFTVYFCYATGSSQGEYALIWKLAEYFLFFMAIGLEFHRRRFFQPVLRG